MNRPPHPSKHPGAFTPGDVVRFWSKTELMTVERVDVTTSKVVCVKWFEARGRHIRAAFNPSSLILVRECVTQ